MCGRYTLAGPPEGLIETFDVPALTFDFVPRYNIAPTQEAPVVAEDRRGRRIGLLRWGFVPRWFDEPGRGHINARGESAAETPSFRDAFRARRCLVPADGFYEWSGPRGARIPHWFHPADGRLLSFGGIWERWERPGQEPVHGFAILTVGANPDVAGVHDRMPLIVPAEARDLWLDRNAPPASLRELIVSAPGGSLLSHVVSKRVNGVAEDDPELVQPVQPPG